jgi:acyl-[acyl-carrier-protein]-phospholipid O-acyltransferase/long-chain-fatty-acid--[acyl-carrier-protein] ligase
MATMGLPNLWIPRRDSFVEVPEIPILGSGKVDLRRVKDIALQHFAGRKSDPAVTSDME